MSTKLPTISVTSEKHSPSSSESSDNDDSNDMDYNFNNGDATDVEDFDSQADVNKPHSRKSSINSLGLSKNAAKDNDVTDVEDYNDSDSEDEKSKVYPELKLSLHEFLQHGLQEQAIVNNEKEKVEVKAGDFLQAQHLNGLADYLTDCEDYNTDSELEYGYDKSVCVDLDDAMDGQGKVCIADTAIPVQDGDDSDEYEDLSVLSDISDLASALSDATGVGLRGMSEDELLEMSGDEEICQITCSDASTDDEANNICDSGSNASLPAIDVAFIGAVTQQRRKSTTIMPGKKTFLEVAATNDEVLTDIERLDDSAAEDDSFDDEDENDQPIPRAIILAAGDDGACLTDIEDVFCDDTSASTATEAEILPVSEKVLPPPHREVVVLKEDKYGDTITNAMPMDNEFQFGIYNDFKNETFTEDEDYSCAEDFELNAILDAPLVANNLIEGEVIVANEILKPQLNKRFELHANAESVTDVEEIYVDGTNRRKKLKTRSMSKGKNKYLEVAKGKEDGGTDVEDMELSESGLPPNVKIVPAKQKAKRQNPDYKVTDVEDLSNDDVSEVSDVEAPQIADDNSSVKEYLVNSTNVVVTLETDAAHKKCPEHTKYKIKSMRLNLIQDDCLNQQNTDVEDIQLPSDAEESNFDNAEPINCNCKELSDMLNESYTVVHEKSGRSFDVEAEKLHIKGMTDTRDAHTDIEYVESDESAARGSN